MSHRKLNTETQVKKEPDTANLCCLKEKPVGGEPTQTNIKETSHSSGQPSRWRWRPAWAGSSPTRPSERPPWTRTKLSDLWDTNNKSEKNREKIVWIRTSHCTLIYIHHHIHVNVSLLREPLHPILLSIVHKNNSKEHNLDSVLITSVSLKSSQAIFPEVRLKQLKQQVKDTEMLFFYINKALNIKPLQETLLRWGELLIFGHYSWETNGQNIWSVYCFTRVTLTFWSNQSTCCVTTLHMLLFS